MNRRWTALALSLGLLLALGAPAASAEDAPAGGAEQTVLAAETPAEEADTETADDTDTPEEMPEQTPSPDAAGTLTFGNLDSRMRESYYPMRALEESVLSIEEIDYGRLEEQLRDQLNGIASIQWMMPAAMKSGSDYQRLESAYNALRTQYDAIRDGKMQENNADALRQLRNAQDQMVIYGETLFIALKGLDAQDAALSRQIAQLDRTVAELELRRDLGQVSALTVEQASAGRAQAVSGQKTLRMNRDAYLLQLENMTGAELGAPLTLGALPKVSAEQLAAMELEADLAKAKAASYELLDAKNTYDDAVDGKYDMGDDAKTYEQKRMNHEVRTAKYTYQDKVQSFELKFRTLYAQVKDCAQALDAARAALTAKEREYAVAALKYDQGNISANALADAKDELAAAKDAVSDAERELFSKYRSYEWGVERGILNS